MLLSEISGILNVAVRRGWLDNLNYNVEMLRGDDYLAKEQIRLIRKSSLVNTTGISLLISSYEKSADKVGLLGEDCEKIQKFFNGIKIAYGTFESISREDFLKEFTAIDLAEIIEEERAALEAILKLGQEIVDKG